MAQNRLQLFVDCWRGRQPKQPGESRSVVHRYCANAESCFVFQTVFVDKNEMYSMSLHVGKDLLTRSYLQVYQSFDSANHAACGVPPRWRCAVTGFLQMAPYLFPLVFWVLRRALRGFGPWECVAASAFHERGSQNRWS